MKLTDDELLSILERRITAAQSGGMAEQDRKQAIDYYLSRPRGDELEGRSQVQSADVADMIEAVLAQVIPSFTGDTVCSFEADGEGDEMQARLESQAVNKVMMEASRGFVVFYEAIKDALLLRNGIIKAWTEDVPYSTTDRYGPLSDDQRAYVASQGELAEDGDGGYTVERSGVRRRLRLQSVDPVNFYVDDEADCILLDDVRGTYEFKVMQRGELVALGLPRAKVEEIPTYQPGANYNDAVRRRQGVAQAAVPSGWAAELVGVWESYVRLDVKGNGTLQLIRTLSATGVLLSKEPADQVCYATGTAIIQPHRWQGLSLHDKLKGVQDVKTATLRGFIDNINVSSNVRVAVNSENVNLADALTSRPGGIIRTRGLPGDNILPLVTNDVGAGAQSLLTYMDKVRAERGGASLDLQAGESQAMGHAVGSQGVDRIYSVQEALAGLMARVLAETLVRSTFLLVHRLLRTEITEPMTLRLADRWVTVDPRSWRERETINIKAGLSPGERNRKAANLTQVVGHQMTLLQAGMDGVLVNLPNLYSAMLDWCAASGIDAGEKYFTDPQGQSAQQAAQAKGQQAQQMQALQVQMAQQQLQLEAQKLQLDKYKADMESRFDYWKAELDAEIKEAEFKGGNARDLELAQIQGRQRAAAGPGAAGGAGNGAGQG